jgi:hypothetical protein
VHQCRVSDIVQVSSPFRSRRFMTFEERIRELCGRVIASGSETEAVQLARQLQSLMHERVEELQCTNGLKKCGAICSPCPCSSRVQEMLNARE